MKTASFGVKLFLKSGRLKEDGTATIYARIRLDRDSKMELTANREKSSASSSARKMYLSLFTIACILSIIKLNRDFITTVNVVYNTSNCFISALSTFHNP